MHFLVRREGARVTFLGLQCEPGECCSLGGQSPARPHPGGDVGAACGLGGEQTHPKPCGNTQHFSLAGVHVWSGEQRS